jgi:hypothetical protein
VEDRILSQNERRKLHPNELEVILKYESITKNKFMRFELTSLKKLIRIATPAQIIATIIRMHKMYPQNFTDFFYIVQPVENMFKNRRGKTKGE